MYYLYQKNMKIYRTWWEKYYIHSIFIITFLFFLYLLGLNSSFLHSSILNYSSIIHEPFDGFVYPIEYIPDPFILTFEQRQLPYEEIDSKNFIKIPKYDPNIFWVNPETLDKESKIYNETLLQRLVYTVPYLWTYEFDYKEYQGSHPWVDIIAPKNTPVKAIANGVVVDTGNYPAWFWNYVVIRHNNVISPLWNSMTVYSNYAHLNEIHVKVGSTIKKWETLWLVGKSGSASNNHLHFQIDTTDSPFHPYWPFTANDMRKANTNMIDWVTMWLWKSDAMSFTLHPFHLIHNDYQPLISLNLERSPIVQKENQEIKNAIVEEKIEKTFQKTDEKKIIETTEELALNDPIPTSFPNNTSINTTSWSQNIASEQINWQNNWIQKEEVLIKEVEILKNEQNFVLVDNEEINALSDYNALLSKEQPQKPQDIYEDEQVKKIIEKIQEPQNNQDVSKKSNTTLKEENTETIIEWSGAINWGDQNISDEKNIVFDEKNTDGNIGKSEIFPSENEKITETLWFKDISQDYKYIQELAYFKRENIIQWYSDNTFRPKERVTRWEAIKIILWAFWEKPLKKKPSLFSDIPTSSWKNGYINKWIELWMISQKNKKFYPEKNISRSEWLKMVFKIAQISLENDIEIKIKDIQKSDWSYPYACYAVQNNFFELKNEKFQPDKPMTREELISILYQMKK